MALIVAMELAVVAMAAMAMTKVILRHAILSVAYSRPHLLKFGVAGGRMDECADQPTDRFSYRHALNDNDLL